MCGSTVLLKCCMGLPCNCELLTEPFDTQLCDTGYPGSLRPQNQSRNVEDGASRVSTWFPVARVY